MRLSDRAGLFCDLIRQGNKCTWQIKSGCLAGHNVFGLKLLCVRACVCVCICASRYWDSAFRLPTTASPSPPLRLSTFTDEQSGIIWNLIASSVGGTAPTDNIQSWKIIVSYLAVGGILLDLRLCEACLMHYPVKSRLIAQIDPLNTCFAESESTNFMLDV